MNPDTRMSWALIVALVLWAPAALAMASGSVEISTGGLIFLAALAFAWVSTGVVAMIVENYKANNERVAEAKRQIELLEQRAAERNERRRLEDQEKKDA